MILAKRVTVERLRKVIRVVLTSPNFRKQALRLQHSIREAGGIRSGVDNMEKLLTCIHPSADLRAASWENPTLPCVRYMRRM